MKVYVVGTQYSYTRRIDNCELVDKIEDAEIVFFTGGADVSPKYYGCKQHNLTWPAPSRDAEEIEAFSKVKSNQLVVGICRGFQLECIMNGGLLVQDVTNHASGYHNITDGKKVYCVTSLHHQMIYPWNLDPKEYDILFWSERKISRHYEGDKINPGKIIVEPEVAVFHKENMPVCLGIQGHPEMMRKSDLFIRELNALVLRYAKRL